MQQGLFLVVEGVDGAGKSTQLSRLNQHLQTLGVETVVTREPGGTPLAETLRSSLLDPALEAISPTTELLLVYAARQQHLDHVIRPALAAGKWVLCDRFIDSSYAYQIRGRELPLSWFEQFNQIVVQDTLPDITLFFDLPDDILPGRLSERTEKSDRLDQERQEFKERVTQGMKERAHDGDHIVIDGHGTMDEVTQRMLTSLQGYIGFNDRLTHE